MADIGELAPFIYIPSKNKIDMRHIRSCMIPSFVWCRLKSNKNYKSKSHNLWNPQFFSYTFRQFLLKTIKNLILI